MTSLPANAFSLYVGNGSWSCRNAETEALMGRELIAVAMDRNFSRFGVKSLAILTP
jgi:hypothetical protein